MQYTIVCYTTLPEKLSQKVNEHIKDGWKPIGGVAVSVQDGEEHFYQAMVKEDENDL